MSSRAMLLEVRDLTLVHPGQWAREALFTELSISLRTRGGRAARPERVGESSLLRVLASLDRPVTGAVHHPGGPREAPGPSLRSPSRTRASCSG